MIEGSTSSRRPGQRRDLPLWKRMMLSLTAVALFFGLLEGGLALFGVRPTAVDQDPFVGFASNSRLFVQNKGPDGGPVLATAKNKRLFNRQQFPGLKEEKTYRIFCMGGSTTFGRPFKDSTSFAGWLRELLPVADPGRRWEVINAGGISYASYRVARLMKELVRYEPDLFIVYTGHNEFLEERSYGALRDTPDVVKSAVELLSHTRTWAGMRLLLKRAGLLSGAKTGSRDQLTAEVDTLLEHFGPEIYERNDALQDQVLEHYRVSLERIAGIAGSAGADVIFVTPASNLKDCSPFKSQHTDGLDPSGQSRSRALLASALEQIRASRHSEALDTLDSAVEIDPRFAELHYRRGKVLLTLGRPGQAKAAFERARDEDVCPLRALSPMREVVTSAARETGSTLIDFVGLLEQALQAGKGHRIPGDEYFLDHVHPTVEGNRMLAVRLIQAMIERGTVQPVDTWGDAAISEVASRVEAGLTAPMRAQALATLSRLMAWTGKTEDAARMASQALEYGVQDRKNVSFLASILATQYALEGDAVNERKYFRMALNAAPKNPELHFRLGLRLMDLREPDLEAGAAHVFFASVFWAGNRRDQLHQILGRIMARRGRYAAAFSNLLEARRLNPEDRETGSLLARLGAQLGPEARSLVPPKVTLRRYPSGALSKIVQVKPGATGRYIADGIWTEWYEGGELKRFVDYIDGKPHGEEVVWSPDGQVVSRAVYRQGIRMKPEGGLPHFGSSG